MDVFVVSYDQTTDIENGFHKRKHNKDIWKKYNDIGIYIDKDIANRNIAMQQIIPYTLIQNDKGEFYSASLITNKDNKENILMTIGFGDNITLEDGIIQPLHRGAIRTLLNYVTLEETNSLKFIGTVRDKAINDKFIGYVFIIKTNNVKINNNMLIGKWMSKDELIDKYSNLETWSKHIVNFIIDDTIQ